MGIIIFIVVIIILVKIPDWKYNNYTPPKGQMIDHNLQSLDKVQHHLTDAEVKANTVAGKYNVKDFLDK